MAVMHRAMSALAGVVVMTAYLAALGMMLVLFLDMPAALAMAHVVMGMLTIDVAAMLALVMRAAMLEAVAFCVLVLFLRRTRCIVLVLGVFGSAAE